MPVYTKSASQTVNNSTTLVTLTGLSSGTLAPNTAYRFEALFAFTSSAVADIKFSLAKGTGLSDATAEWGEIDTTSGIAPLAFGVADASGSATGNQIIGYSGLVIVGTDPGTFVFQFAQNTAEVSDTIVVAAVLEVYATEATTAIGKSSSETRVSTTTLADDGALVSSTLATGTVYKIELLIPINSHITPDIKYALERTGLSDATLYIGPYAQVGAVVTAKNFGGLFSSSTSGVDQLVGLVGILATGSDPGSIKFQWAQLNTSIQNSTVLAGAVLRLVS